MCGGFSITANASIIKARFKAELPKKKITPNFNARPGQDLPVVLSNDPKHIKTMFWGYVPHWIKDQNAKKR